MKEERLIEIEDFIKQSKVCKIENLQKEFNVSMSTLRRDLALLTRQGKISKVYGGVVFNGEKEEQMVYDRSAEQLLPERIPVNEKLDRISEAASRLVEDGDIIILGSGYTVYHMIHYLLDKKDLVIVTNNMLIVAEALKHDLEVVVLGGKLNKQTFSVTGTLTSNNLKNMSAHLAFIGTDGIVLNQGFSNCFDQEAELKQIMIQISSQTVVLADHSKFDNLALYKFSDPENIEAVVTDSTVSEDYVEYFKNADVRLIVADGDN